MYIFSDGECPSSKIRVIKTLNLSGYVNLKRKFQMNHSFEIYVANLRSLTEDVVADILGCLQTFAQILDMCCGLVWGISTGHGTSAAVT